MRIGINLLLWAGHVTAEHRPVIEHIAETGFDGIEVPIFQVDDPAHYGDLGAMLDDLGLARTASTAFTDPAHDPVSPQASLRDAAFDQACRIIECTHTLGGELLVGPIFQVLGQFTGQGPSDAELDRCAEFLSRLGPVFQDSGMACALEPLNRFEAHILNTCEQARAILERVAHPAIGVLYDTFHAHIEEKGPIDALSTLLGRDQVAHVHISENDRGTPGTGHARIAETIEALKASDYNGWLTIEAFGTAVPELAAATRVWRPFFADPMDVVTDGYAFIHQCLGTVSPE